MHPSTAQLLELFEYRHMPEDLQKISKQFYTLAQSMAQQPTERGQEKTECLRKLLEAKDCAVRMGVPSLIGSELRDPTKTGHRT